RDLPGIEQFDVVWFPPPSKSWLQELDALGNSHAACGYLPLDYFDIGSYTQSVELHDGTVYTHAGAETLYGSEVELRAAIDTLHSRGVRVLADVVVNHRAGWRRNAEGEICNWATEDTTLASGQHGWGGQS